MNTPLAQSAESNILRFKDHASETQFRQMIEAIKGFDTDLSGCGHYAIQAKLKLKQISDLSLVEFQAICELFKD
jgi:hypothetical protein